MSELIDQLQRALRARHYSRRTEQAYCLWVRRYVRFHGLRHPADMAEPEINAFVTHLAVTEHVSASTQTQALSALLFLYRHVLHRQVGELHELVRARKQPRLPVVLSREEVRAVLHELDRDDRQSWLIASLLYGAGLRLTECLRLRVLDLDLARGELTVRSGKGGKDRATTLPQALVPDLREQLRRAQLLHERDLADGWGAVELPAALERKYPRAPCEWRWQWVFPQQRRWTDRAHRPPGPPPRPPDHRPARRPGRRRGAPASTSTPPATRSATPSPRTCSRPATTSAPSRSSSATRTSAPP